jgi:hypothetical protein
VVHGPQYNDNTFLFNGSRYMQYNFCRVHLVFEHVPGFIEGGTNRSTHHFILTRRNIFTSRKSRHANDVRKYSVNVRKEEM